MGRHQHKAVSKESIHSQVKKSTRSHVKSDSKKSLTHIDRAYQIYKYLCPILNLSYTDFTKVSEVLSKDKLGDTFIETFIESINLLNPSGLIFAILPPVLKISCKTFPASSIFPVPLSWPNLFKVDANLSTFSTF